MQLTTLEGKPDVPVRLHTSFQVVAHAHVNVSTPIVTPADAVLIALSPSAPTRTGIYFALKPGHITVAASITGGPGDYLRPLYGATFMVR